MNKLVFALPFALLLVSSQAEARRYMFPGTMCQPVAGWAGCVERGSYGVNNVCQFPITVDCPLPWSIPNSGITLLTGGYFTAYDRNSTQDVSCSLILNSWNGSSSPLQTLSTSGSQSGVIRKDFTAVSEPVDGWLSLRCTLPVVTTTGPSYLTNILLTTND